MIWLRRFLTLPLFILLILAICLDLVITQVNATVTDPKFYNNQLVQDDVYNFLYDKVLPAALDDAAANQSSDNVIEISALKNEIVSTARKVLPPEWLRAQLESANAAVSPYFLGEADSFNYNLVFKDRVEKLSQVLKDEILSSSSFDTIYSDSISLLAEKFNGNLNKLPYNLSLSKEQIEKDLRNVVSKEWMAAQVSSAITALTPYLAGDSEHFEINLQFKDRIDSIASAVLDLLGDQATYVYLIDQIIVPTISSNIGKAVKLPFQVILTDEEITQAMRQVCPPEWVQARFTDLVNGLTGYVKGQSEAFRIVIDFTTRKGLALQVLSKLADAKLQAYFESLPVVNQESFRQTAQNLPAGSVPGVRPPGTYEQFKSDLGIDIPAAVSMMVINAIPDKWTYSLADLRGSLGPDDTQFLDKVRNWADQGYTFTEIDLQNQLDSAGIQDLKDARNYMKNGYQITDTKLKEQITEGENGSNNLAYLDMARNDLHLFKKWWWVGWLVPLILLCLIGILGGRQRWSKILWGLIPLFIITGIICIGSGPVYSGMIEPHVVKLISMNRQTELNAVLIDKGNEMISNAINTFVAGIGRDALYIMTCSGLIIAGIIVLGILRQRYGVSSIIYPEEDEKEDK